MTLVISSGSLEVIIPECSLTRLHRQQQKALEVVGTVRGGTDGLKSIMRACLNEAEDPPGCLRPQGGGGGGGAYDCPTQMSEFPPSYTGVTEGAGIHDTANVGPPLTAACCRAGE